MSDSINEILTDAANDIRSIMKHANNKYLRNFMRVAYIPEWVMLLPEGTPPFKKNTAEEYQLKGTFWQICKKISILCEKDLPTAKRELYFINALESLPEVEANILLAAKEQKMSKLFKGVTTKALLDVGYFVK